MANLPNDQRVPKFGDEAAFPRDAIKSEPASERMMTLLPAQWGLTKRELFAAMAMQGHLAALGGEARHDDVARDAVAYADALLTALKETP